MQGSRVHTYHYEHVSINTQIMQNTIKPCKLIAYLHQNQNMTMKAIKIYKNIKSNNSTLGSTRMRVFGVESTISSYIIGSAARPLNISDSIRNGDYVPIIKVMYG